MGTKSVNALSPTTENGMKQAFIYSLVVARNKEILVVEHGD